ncbi:MAG: penicillin-binding protein [Thermoflavifilum sp.]|nr:penicillin-binding protein [Thermoflavifilum sp.]
MPQLIIHRSVKILWRIFFIGLGTFILLILLINWGVFGYMPSLHELENPQAALASEVYAADGTLMGKYYLQNQDRTYCEFKDISPNVIHALIATEDVRFYQHSGIDPKGTIAIPFYLLIGKKRGSSTITQQLAFNLFNGHRASNPLIRAFQKLKEWILAIKLERYFTKDEILALYLNTVPFSENVYGIKNASRTFFNKDPDALDVDEAATLIGMLKGTTLYNPRRNPVASLNRRNTVIERMADAGFLTRQQAAAYEAQPIRLQYNKLDHNDGIAPYFREYIKEAILKPWCATHKKADGSSYDLYRDGLRIYTTINPRMQQHAEEAVARHLSALQKVFNAQSYIKNGSAWKGYQQVLIDAMKSSDRWQAMKDAGMSDREIEQFFLRQRVPMRVFAWNRTAGGVRNSIDTVMTPMDSIKYMQQFLQCGMLVMDPESGEVKAWVGGDDFRYFKYDHVNINTKRQVGSTIKPFLYYLAIANGFTPNTVVPNQPVVFPDFNNYSPHNAENDTATYVTLAQGLAESLNNVAAYLIKIIGPATFANFLKNKIEIQSPVPPYPSIALGSPDISVYEMVRGYTIFPDKGILTEPLLITRIEDRNGNILQSFAPQKRDVINERDAYTMVQMMEGVVNHGTAVRLRYQFGFTGDMAGKTGTTNDYTDGWYIGFTPQLLAGVWVGCDHNFLHFTTLANGQGANTGLPIWGYFFQKVFADPTLGITQRASFEAPPSYQNPIMNSNVQPYPSTGNAVPPAASEAQNLGSGSASDYLHPNQQPAADADQKDPRKPKALMPPPPEKHRP